MRVGVWRDGDAGLGRGAAGQAVLEELLVLGPPLLAEQRLSPLRGMTARHDLVSPAEVQADSWLRLQPPR